MLCRPFKRPLTTSLIRLVGPLTAVFTMLTLGAQCLTDSRAEDADSACKGLRVNELTNFNLQLTKWQ